MRVSISELKKQFERARKSGWLPLIRAAADRYQFTPDLLLAIGSRETNLDPRYQSHPGDRGHGFSMWQIDIGSYPDWIKTGAWRDVGQAVMKSAEVLNEKRNEVLALAKRNKLILSSADVEQITIAAYNHGSRGSFLDYQRFRRPDRGTTGGDYSQDVLYRSDIFKSFLTKVPARVLVEEQARGSQPLKQHQAGPGLFQRIATNDDARRVGRSAGKKLLNRIGTPLTTLLMALEAGNIYAWLGVAVALIGVVLFIYFERRTIARLIARVWLRLTTNS
jgi:hypothetical protein